MSNCNRLTTYDFPYFSLLNPLKKDGLTVRNIGKTNSVCTLRGVVLYRVGTLGHFLP